MSITTEYMLDTYGPLLTLPQLAKLFGRSADGVRLSLLHDGEFARQIKPSRIKLGRRVYFRTEDVAKIISPREAS